MKRTHKSTLALTCAALAFAGLPPRALAQRGANYTLDGSAPTTPSSGFPGMFDSNVADKGSFVADLPSLAADYGLTENVTIGTNGLFVGLLVFGIPAVYVKTRYRFLASEQLASSLTGYAGYVTNRVGRGAGSADIDGYLFAASNNTTWYFSPKSYANAFFYSLKFGINARDRDSLEYSKTSVTTVLVGGSYQHWLTRWFGPQALLALSPYNNIGIDSSTLSVDATLGNSQVGSGFAILRALAEFRVGRWLLSPGFMYVVGLGGESSSNDSGDSDDSGGGGGGLIPLMSGTVKW